MEQMFHSTHNIVYACTYHVVWCPKYRRKVLQGGIDDRLKAIIREVATERQAEVIELEVMPDHVHLLVGCDPQFGIHRLTRLMTLRVGAERHQRPLVALVAPGVPVSPHEVADTLDE